MKKIQTLIITPMEKERDAFMAGLTVQEQNALQSHSLVETSGIGKVNAAVCVGALVELARPQIDCVVTVGCAGALSPKLRLGDIVVSTDSSYWDVDCGGGNLKGQVQGMPPVFLADKSLVRKVAGAIKMSRGIEKKRRVFTGSMLTGDKFFEKPGSERALHQEFPQSLTVDMETAAVAQACLRMNVPYVSVRVVSDTFGGNRKKEYKEFWSKVAVTGFDFSRPVVEAVARWREGRK